MRYYHDDMAGEVFFLTWFRSFLTKLSPISVRVMGSASYHSLKVERIPTCRGERMTIISRLKIVIASATAYERGTYTAIRELANGEGPVYCHISGYLYWSNEIICGYSLQTLSKCGEFKISGNGSKMKT
jgi:hypothetical protein